jgi:hypothetical protein
MGLTEYVPGDTPKQFTAAGGRRLGVLVARGAIQSEHGDIGIHVPGRHICCGRRARERSELRSVADCGCDVEEGCVSLCSDIYCMNANDEAAAPCHNRRQ